MNYTRTLTALFLAAVIAVPLHSARAYVTSVPIESWPVDSTNQQRDGERVVHILAAAGAGAVVGAATGAATYAFKHFIYPRQPWECAGAVSHIGIGAATGVLWGINIGFGGTLTTGLLATLNEPSVKAGLVLAFTPVAESICEWFSTAPASTALDPLVMRSEFESRMSAAAVENAITGVLQEPIFDEMEDPGAPNSNPFSLVSTFVLDPANGQVRRYFEDDDIITLEITLDAFDPAEITVELGVARGGEFYPMSNETFPVQGGWHYAVGDIFTVAQVVQSTGYSSGDFHAAGRATWVATGDSYIIGPEESETAGILSIGDYTGSLSGGSVYNVNSGGYVRNRFEVSFTDISGDPPTSQPVVYVDGTSYGMHAGDTHWASGQSFISNQDLLLLSGSHSFHFESAQGSLSLRDPADGEYQFQVVDQGPIICLTPASLTFYVEEVGSASGTVSITNCGNQTLNWYVDENNAEISASPTSGATTTETDHVTFTFTNNENFPTGTVFTYSDVWIRSNGGDARVPITIHVIGNSLPDLRSGSVTPPSGESDELYRFRVEYRDLDNTPPVQRDLVIDGNLRYQMTTNATNWDTYVEYFFENYLAPGNHYYHCEFRDPSGALARFPSTGERNYPVVTPVQPEVHITRPANNELPVDQSFLIQWTLTGANTLDLYWDNDVDPGAGLHLIASQLSNTGSYLWSTSTLENGTYWVYGIANNQGMIDSDYSDFALVIIHNQVEPIWNWTQPALISALQPQNATRALEVGPANLLGLAYSNGATVYYKRSLNAGFAWSDSILTGSYNLNEGDLVVDSVGNPVLFGMNPAYYEATLTRSSDGGLSWLAPVTLFPNDGLYTGDTKAVLYGNRIHTVYLQRGNPWQIYYRYTDNSGSTWSTPVNISNSFDDVDHDRYEVYCDATGVYIVWIGIDSGFNDHLYLRRSSNNGASWGPQILVTNHDDSWTQPLITSIQGVKYIICATDPSYIWRSTDNGATWSAPLAIPVPNANFYSIGGCDNKLMLVSRESGVDFSITIRESSDQGTSWSDTAICVQSTPHTYFTATYRPNDMHLLYYDAQTKYKRTVEPFVNSNPEVIIVLPSVGIHVLDSIAQCSWIATDPDSLSQTVVVDLFYDTDLNPSSATPIASGLPDTDEIGWNVTAVPADTYYVLARAYDGAGGIDMDYSDGAVIVNHRPAFAFNTPQSDDTAGSNYLIEWSSADPDQADSLVLSLYYSTSLDTPGMVEIADSVANSGTFLWQTGTSPENVPLRLIARASDFISEPVWVISSGTVLLDYTSPSVVWMSPMDGDTTEDEIVTCSGQITDEGTGVISAQYRINLGDWIQLTLDSTTFFAFSFAPEIGLNSLRVRATDRTGNISESTLNVVGVNSECILSGVLPPVIGPGPCRVTSNISVPVDSVTSILPGSTLQFEGDFGLVVNGTLIADGTAMDSIVFTADQATVSSGWRGIQFTGADGSTVLSYCTIENVCLDGVNASDRGGGIDISSCSPTLQNCFVRNCTARNGGGIACDSGATPLISNCVVDQNHATEKGGGVWCYEASPTLLNCVIRNNVADLSGGGLRARLNASPTVINCLLYGNEAPQRGGGIELTSNANAVIKHCVIDQNSAASGAGIHVSSSTPQIANTIVSNNVGTGLHFTGSAESQLSFNDVFGNTTNWSFETNDPLQGPTGIGIQSTLNANQDSCDRYSNMREVPGFTDQTNNEYVLSSSSRCIGAASNSGSYPTDHVGATRPMPSNSNADIGAFESSLGQPPILPPNPVDDLVIYLSANNHDVILAWSLAARATSYNVYADSVADFEPSSGNLVGITTDTMFADVGVIEGQPMRFYVVTSSTSGLVPPGMVLVPSSEFAMGSQFIGGNAIPEHQVTLDAFYIDIYEVTNAQYKAFCDAQTPPRDYPLPPYPEFDGISDYFTNPDYANYPVVMVSWDDARDYAFWAEKRLPTEAEWERAAKDVASNSRYPWGDNWVRAYTNISGAEDGFTYTALIGSFPDGASTVGCFDMAGNVWEWCEDDWHSSYVNAPTNGGAWINIPRDSRRVTRGGSWPSPQSETQCAWRGYYYQTDRFSTVGFRCAKTP